MKSDESRPDKENDEPGIGRLAYGYPDPDELHKLLDEAEVSRKISTDSGATWRTYSVAERLKILVGGYKLAERELAEAEQREPSKLAKILAEARASDEYRQESERLNAPSAGVQTFAPAELLDKCIMALSGEYVEKPDDAGEEWNAAVGYCIGKLRVMQEQLPAVAQSATQRR